MLERRCVKILVDTHILLWMPQDSPCLSHEVRNLFANSDTELYYSSVSISEISVKHRVHPEEMPLTGDEVVDLMPNLGCTPLDFKASHAATMDGLPMHHRDPFDRMLLAQAKTEGMKLMSHDRQFPQYGDFVIAV